MFESMKRKLEERQKVKGLSKGLRVVEELMVSGLSVQALDQNYGRADMTLKLMRSYGEITQNEYGAAMATLNNQYDKLRKRELKIEMFA